MLNKEKLKLISGTVLLAFSLCCIPAVAEETEDVAELKKQIEVLQKRVEELETEKEDEDSFYTPRSRFRRGFGFGWDPFDEMDRMQEQMNQMFQNSFSRGGSGKRGMFSSNMSFDYDFDLKETNDGYEIKFDMTGLDKEKIDIQINEHSITVKGEHSRQDAEESQNSFFSSQSFGSFMKTIPLPVDADTSKIKTEKEGDTLVIRLPKKES